MEKINFEKCPLCLSQFAILDIESEKKYRAPAKGARKARLLTFRENSRIHIRVLGQ
jgi:hypothetical protein